MKKRLFTILLAVVLLLTVCPFQALADFDFETIGSPHIIVFDSADLTVSNPFYEKDADAKVFPASTTKMLTCILAIENSQSLDTPVTVGEEIKGFYEIKKGYTENSSLMGLVVGETVTMRDLLHGLMLLSGNDAADAIAVAIGGTIDNFVAMMNSKAAELGMTNSHFMNPNGVHNENHYSTARDMAKLAAYCMTNNQFAAIVRTATYEVPANEVRTAPLSLINSNLLLTAEGRPQYASLPYEYCIGIKTGFTTKSGNCLVASAEKGGAKPIVCLYGAPDEKMSNDRFSYAKQILEYLFNEKYTTIQAEELNLPTTFSCKIENARPEDVNENGEIELTASVAGLSVTSTPEKIQAMKSNPAGITAKADWTDTLSAPIHQGQLLGTITYYFNGDPIVSAELTAPSDVLEVAIIQSDPETQGENPEADLLEPADSLLTAPETAPREQTEKTDKKGLSPFVLIVIIVIGILVLTLVVLLVLSSIKKKRRKKLREQRRRQMQQRQAASGQAGAAQGASRNAQAQRPSSYPQGGQNRPRQPVQGRSSSGSQYTVRRTSSPQGNRSSYYDPDGRRDR